MHRLRLFEVTQQRFGFSGVVPVTSELFYDLALSREVLFALGYMFTEK